METQSVVQNDCTKNGQKMFVLVKDGHNVEHKVVNFNNPEMVPNKGIVIIRSLKKSSRQNPSSNFRCFRDPVTEIIWGMPNGLNEFTKDLKFQLIEIGDMRQYDLSVAQDRKEWAVISKAPFLVGSPYQKGKPTHQIFDVEQEAVKKIKKVGEREAANAIIKTLSHLQLVDMARNCGGIDTKHNSMMVIQSELYEFAEKKPEDFNRIWTMTNRESLTVFKRCMLVGLINLDINSGYLWKKATPLGTSEAMAIDFITNNHSLLMSMDNESKLLDSEFQMNATEEEKTAYISNQPLPKKVDSEIMKTLAAQEKRMADQDMKMDKLMAIIAANTKPILDAESKHFDLPEIIKPIENTLPKQEIVEEEVVPKVVDPELLELQQRANKLGMKHSYVTKSKEKIIAWMEANSVQQ